MLSVATSFGKGVVGVLINADPDVAGVYTENI